MLRGDFWPGSANTADVKRSDVSGWTAARLLSESCTLEKPSSGLLIFHELNDFIIFAWLSGLKPGIPKLQSLNTIYGHALAGPPPHGTGLLPPRLWVMLRPPVGVVGGGPPPCVDVVWAGWDEET